MTRAERFQNREREKRRKELELSRYTHSLSHKILTLEGKEELGRELPDIMVASFQKGSLLDRDIYWQENAKDLNFGQQMLTWMGYEDGKPGMAQWVAKQKGNDAVTNLLQEVGLAGDHEGVVAAFNQGKVADLLKTINADLVKAGEEPLELKDLNDDQARSLIFYAQYLNPTDKRDSGRDAKELINTLVKQASSDSNGDASQTIAKLQQIVPLLRVAGEEGQYVLGALMVAKAHAFDARDELIKVAPDAVLTDDEKSILEFLKKQTEEVRTEKMATAAPGVLEANKPYNIQEVFTQLSPEPTPGHKYWIDHEVSPDFAASLTHEQLKSLELRKTWWTLEGDNPLPNREVFDPAYTLESDNRFANAELLTNEDSGIFALAAASAKTPEQQATLYKILGEVIVRTHSEDTQLLAQFLQAQTEESQFVLTSYEDSRARPLIDAKNVLTYEKAKQEMKQRYQIDWDPKIPISLTQEQHDHLLQLLAPAIEQEGKIRADATAPDRLLSFSIYLGEGAQFGQILSKINTEETQKVWPEKVLALQEALQKDPLTLTPEQIRQIEFLGHAVDSVKVIEMLQQTQATQRVEETVEAAVIPAPVAKQEVQTPEILEETVVTPEAIVVRKKLDEFFQLFDHLEERAQTSKRQEMALMDTTHLSEFSTEGRDVKRYEIYQTGDEERNLAIYNVRQDANGRMQHFYNEDNNFFWLLLQDNTLSRKTFEDLSGLKHYGPNTLLAYVLEASTNSSQQETLFRKLFSQIAKIYQEHPELYKEVLDYFTSVSAQSSEPIHEMKVVEPLFGSAEKAAGRLAELRNKLADPNAEFTAEDFVDMGFFALPFNLKLIAEEMKEAYNSHGAFQAKTEPQP